MAANDKGMAFLPPEPERTLSARTWAVAALAILLVLGIAAVATLRTGSGNTGEIRAADPYADHLPIRDIQLSEATNGTGGKATYVDGTIDNTGTKTLTGALVQVTFTAVDGTTPHRETVPLTLVRTRVPYVDLQPVSAAPVGPSRRREFRLIFESVPENWDVKPPMILLVHADLK